MKNWKDRMPAKNSGDDLRKEIAYCKELEKRIESDPTLGLIPTVKEKLNLLKETVIDTQENLIFSKDQDAKTGHKSADSSFFRYKTHNAMTEERIITAAVVTSGEKGDGSELPKLLEASQENGMEIDTIIGDAAYSEKENLKLAEKQHIRITTRLNPSIYQDFRRDEDKFDYNKDADRFVYPAGHKAVQKARQSKKNTGENKVDTYYFDVGKCKACPFKDGFYKTGAKTKTYSVTLKSNLHQE